ncbi:MAG: hypothetical protein HDR14_05675 [Lachnospiraceae bacterium]|nr:hypothetical protein [Lachnospiraceae bacterium]
MQNYDEIWNQYAIKFADKLESVNGGNWNKLDEIEQEIAALWKLTTDMYSVGFDYFFLNWGYECYFYAMRGIKRIADTGSALEETSCSEVYELFDNAYAKVFARFKNDERIKAYRDIVEYLTEDDEEILDDVFAIFDDKLCSLLCERAYKFYCEKLKKRV